VLAWKGMAPFKIKEAYAGFINSQDMDAASPTVHCKPDIKIKVDIQFCQWHRRASPKPGVGGAIWQAP